jgi:hypothetical protein
MAKDLSERFTYKPQAPLVADVFGGLRACKQRANITLAQIESHKESIT